MTLDELKRQLKNKQPERLYFFVGKEAYLKSEAYSLLIERFSNPASQGLNINRFSLKETGLDRIIDAARTFPMMDPYRLVFVRDVENISEGDRTLLYRYLQDPPATTITVFDAEELDRRAELYRELSRRCASVEFNPLRGQALLRWVHDRVISQGFSAEFSTLQRLIDCAGSDLQAICNELEKLFLYAAESKHITSEMIDELAVRSRHYSIFELIDAVGKRQRRRALQILNRLLDDGQQPLLVLAMLARHFRQLMIAKELLRKRASQSHILREAQIPEFLIDDFIKQARSFGDRELSESLRSISEADLLFKSTSVNQRIHLEQMICRLGGKS